MKSPESTKRVPTLADVVVANNHPLCGKLIGSKATSTLKGRIRSARKFVFDRDATAKVAQVVHDIPELILREFAFARTPFDLCWIEYDAETYWSILMDQRWDDDHHDKRIGFLFDHNKVNVFAEGDDAKDTGGCGIYPFAYHLNTEWPVEDQLRFAKIIGTSRLGIDLWMWGSSAQKFLDAGETGRLRVLRDHNMAEFIGRPEYLKALDTSGILQGAQGDMRTIVALLLMLNRPSIVQYRNSLPNATGFIKNKLRAYMAHTMVTVAIDPVTTLKLINTPEGEAVPRRRHEVRGHYCHDKAARDYARIAGCIHDWQTADDEWTPTPDVEIADADRWICKQCAGKRWWRADHERGDASRGYVIHDYNVTTRL